MATPSLQTPASEGDPAGVNADSDLWKDKNENPGQIDFINLDQTLGV